MSDHKLSNDIIWVSSFVIQRQLCFYIGLAIDKLSTCNELNYFVSTAWSWHHNSYLILLGWNKVTKLLSLTYTRNFKSIKKVKTTNFWATILRSSSHQIMENKTYYKDVAGLILRYWGSVEAWMRSRKNSIYCGTYTI